MDTKTILLDVGGTYIKCTDGRQIPVHSDGDGATVAAALRKAIGPVKGLKGIGVSIPGPFDYREGRFLMKHKFASVYGKTFRALARIPDDVQLRFAHDVNAVLMGAISMLSLQDSSCALVTLGTGLGFSYSIKGRVQCNSSGSPAYSLWNVPRPGGGILEDELSARGVCADYASRTGDSTKTAYAIARMGFAGDPTAIGVYENLGARLGSAVKGILGEIGSEVLLLGGQVSKSIDLMIRPLQEALPGIRILQAPDNAVFEGLACLFNDNSNNQEYLCQCSRNCSSPQL
ncbi:MAG: ROK family protein [Bacteroidales bacterium]|nr:ROK family protein [Bacteroidales bacterium]